MNVPSIVKQTPWPTRFVNYGRALDGPGNPRFFNPSIIEHNGSIWLVPRKAEEKIGTKHGMNSIWAFRLGADLQPVAGLKIPLSGAYKNQHFEDPRITKWNGQLFLSYCTFVVNADDTWHGAHQGTAMLTDDWQVASMQDPLYGANGGSVMQNTGNEKNWLWFEHEGQLMCVYMTQPHQVLSWTFGPTVSAQYHTEGDEFGAWKFGHVRGGTPPVRVGDEYWSFFHSSIDGLAPNGKRRYFMGAYSFEAKPPFRVTSITPKPLLVASENDPFHGTLPLVVFPCGAIFKEGVWTVSLGVNDCCSATIQIPHGELKEQTKESGRTSSKPAEDAGVSEDVRTVANRPKRRRMARRRPRQPAVARGSGDSGGQQSC